MVKLFHCLDEPQVPLLDKVQKLHSPAHIPLGDGDHQPEVGLGEALAGDFIPLGHPHRQVNLLIGGKEGHPANLLKVHLHRVVNADALGVKDAFQVAVLFGGGRHLGGEVLHNLDVVVLEGVVELIHLLHVKVQLLQGVVNLLGGQLSLCLAHFDKLSDNGFLVLQQ